MQDEDGTVLMVFGPPLLQYSAGNPDLPLLAEEGSQEIVPQPPYECGNTQKSWDRKQPILFSTGKTSGVNLAKALDGKFAGILDRDSFPFNEDCRGITIRIHVGLRKYWFVCTNLLPRRVSGVPLKHACRKDTEGVEGRRSGKGKGKVNAGV